MASEKNTDPLVSICIPVYNSETTIAKTLASVIGQTYQNIEIVVVDNLSTDRTLERVREFSDPRIRIVENPEHFRCAEYNWNTCFAHARGEFIALFHADDMYAPDMVARQIGILEENPSVNGVFTSGEMIDEQDRVIGVFRLPPGISGNTPYGYRQLLAAALEHDNYLLCPSALIRGNVYRNLAPFRYDQFGSASDFDMWLRVAQTGPVVIIDENLLKYRVSTNQWSHTLRARTQEADGFRTMDFHIAECGDSCSFSDTTLARYELRRLQDQIFCALNFLKKHDRAGFRQHLKRMPWKKYLRILVRRPHIALPILIRGILKVPEKVRT
jgi:glycosyltransferase involved in cell wall biosynthesis